MAHELGHGAFQLRHIWLEPGYTHGTPNLMGDTRTPELFRWQWEHIHHPVSHSNLGKEEEELGAAQILFVKVSEIKGSEGMYVTPSGLPIWIDDMASAYVLNSADGGVQKVNWTTEALLGFKTKNGTKYWADIRGNAFYGYYNTTNTDNYDYYTSFKTKEIVENGDYQVSVYREPNFESTTITSRFWVQYQGNWGTYKGEGLLVENADCNCTGLYQKRKSEGYALVANVSPVQTAIVNDNCLLKIPTVDINPFAFIEESEFMKGFNSFYKAGMIAIFGPIAVKVGAAAAIQPVVESAVAAYQPCIDAGGYLVKELVKRTSVDFYIGFGLNAGVQYGVNVINGNGILDSFKEIDYLDAGIAGISCGLLSDFKNFSPLLNSKHQIALFRNSVIVVFEFTSATIDWKPFSSEVKYKELFNGKKESECCIELIGSVVGLEDFEIKSFLDKIIKDKKLPEWLKNRYSKIANSPAFYKLLDQNKDLLISLWEEKCKLQMKSLYDDDEIVFVHYKGTIDISKMSEAIRSQMLEQAKQLGGTKKDNVTVKNIKWQQKN